MDRRRFLESAAMGAAASAPIMKAVTARSAVAATPLPWETFVARMGMQVPIVQAPSGGTTWPCAPAVANAGGMGALGLTRSTEADAVAAIRAVKAATAKPFLINYALGALSSEPKTLPAVLAERVPVVSFSWGDPAPYAADVKRSGARLGMQISSVEGLELAKQAGCDFVICQGVEAGGHVQATRSLDAVLPSVLAQAEGMPALAAGGIGTSKQIAQFLAAGASGVVMGTRFVASVESNAHDVWRQPTHPCPCCGSRMVIIETFAAGCVPRYRPTIKQLAIRIDTS